MISIGLIIQETRSGLENQYTSDHLDARTTEISTTLTDERLLATQLANHSNVYSVQITKNYKVYSLIVTNVSDSFGRAGFSAIRLYVPIESIINDIETCLLSIKESYVQFKISNSLNLQNYNSILSSILFKSEVSQIYVCLKSKEDAVVYLESNASALNSVLENKNCNLFNKVYIFDKTKAANIDIAIKQGLILFSNLDIKAREIEISDPNSILKHIKINHVKLEFDINSKELIVLSNREDVISYNTSEDDTYKTINSSYYIIKKKQKPPPVIVHKQEEDAPKFPLLSIFLVLGFMVVLFGVGVWYLFFNDDKTVTVVNNFPRETTKDSSTIQDTSSHSQTTLHEELNFIKDSAQGDSMIFKTNFSKLQKYRFTFIENKWFFKNVESEKKYEEFFTESVTTIFKLDSIKLSQKDDFLKKLEIISGNRIPQKTKAQEQLRQRSNSLSNSTVKKINAKITLTKSKTQVREKRVGEGKL